MSDLTQTFTEGQPVTVRIHDGHREALVVDGFVQRAEFFVDTDLSRGFSKHVPTDRTRKNARPFMVIETASGKDFGHDLDRWRTGPDHQFQGRTLWVTLSAPSPDGPAAAAYHANGEALARIENDLSPERIVAKAVAALTETDPALAQRLVGAVEEIETAAYTRGCDSASEYY